WHRQTVEENHRPCDAHNEWSKLDAHFGRACLTSLEPRLRQLPHQLNFKSTRPNKMKIRSTKNEDGFSLFELIIAMGITITILGLATSILAGGFRVRTREDAKSDGIADVQRALNIMTREISNSGLRLPSGLGAVGKNGVV